MNFSFLGVGNMGLPLAMNLIRANENVLVYTRRPDCATKFRDAGARVAAARSELADCDVLCTCLPQPQHVIDAVTGPDGLYKQMKPGAIHLEFSTIAPATANMLAAQAADSGLEYVQATVSKTPAVAAAGEAPLFLGGSQSAIRKLWGILEKIAKPYDLKTIDAACGVKLISNLIGMSNIALVAEGLRIGQAAGIAGQELLDLLLDTGCASYQMKVRGPWMLAHDFEARFSIDIAAKDLRLGCAMAEDLGLNPELMRQTLRYLEKGHAQGIGEEDVSALYKIVGKK